jgi:DNA polymerase III delta prime subunit
LTIMQWMNWVPTSKSRSAILDLRQNPEKKLRAKKIVRRIAQTRRYEPTSSGLKAIVALVVLRNKAIKPLLAAAQELCKSRARKIQDPSTSTTKPFAPGVFEELGLAA